MGSDYDRGFHSGSPSRDATVAGLKSCLLLPSKSGQVNARSGPLKAGCLQSKVLINRGRLTQHDRLCLLNLSLLSGWW